MGNIETQSAFPQALTLPGKQKSKGEGPIKKCNFSSPVLQLSRYLIKPILVKHVMNQNIRTGIFTQMHLSVYIAIRIHIYLYMYIYCEPGVRDLSAQGCKPVGYI